MSATATAALAAAEKVIDAIPQSGLANGSPYSNTAMPNTSHVREHLKWPLKHDGSPVTLAEHICEYAKVDMSEAARKKVAKKSDIDTAVIVAIARMAGWKYYGWAEASLNASEVVSQPVSHAAKSIHADHEKEVIRALVAWATPAARYMGLFYYNAISYETSSHHHLPVKTKRLATTTITLTGLKDWMAGDADREGSVFHDCFHPVSDTEKSNAARRVSAKNHLSSLKFDNLRKRIPVKAPDSGVAINYQVLFTKAKAYHHDPADVPAGLEAPANLAVAIKEYEQAGTAKDLMTAVDKLREFSEELAEPSAYLAGYILGREANAMNDKDLDLREAQKTTTILGSPAYARAAAEYSGSFAAGKAQGFTKVAASVPSQVLPRCTQAVARASSL